MYRCEKYKQQKCPEFNENNHCDEISPSVPDLKSPYSSICV